MPSFSSDWRVSSVVKEDITSAEIKGIQTATHEKLEMTSFKSVLNYFKLLVLFFKEV